MLDFLWACLHKPCLWQERVKKEAVVNSYLSLVHFTHNMYMLYFSLSPCVYIRHTLTYIHTHMYTHAHLHMFRVSMRRVG